MIRIDINQIKAWMDEKYEFWRTSFPYFRDKEESFWKLHPIAELPKRVQYLNILGKHVKDPSFTTVVDVGIGGGMFPYLLDKLKFNVIGLDWGGISAQIELERLHPDINVYSLFFERETWPVESNSIDISTFLDAIEHIHPPLEFLLSEMYRILKPGAVLIITTPNQANLRKRLTLLCGRSIYNPLRDYYEMNPFVNHIREFTCSELSQLVKWAGFQVNKEYCIDHLFFSKYAEAQGILKKLMLQIYRLATLLRTDLKDTIVLEARKPIKK